MSCATSVTDIGLIVTFPIVALKDQNFSFLLVSPGVVNTAEAPRKSTFRCFICNYLTVCTAPPEALVEIQKMAGAFLKVYPNWKGPINPPESVSLLLGLLASGDIAPGLLLCLLFRHVYNMYKFMIFRG